MDKSEANRRVLVVDDEHDLLKSYDDILTARYKRQSMRAKGLFSTSEDEEKDKTIGFEVSAADQGQAAVELARQALKEERPFAVAFIDMRMPPGWDGLETARALRNLDTRINIVIVTAFADKSIDELQSVLKYDVLQLRKPFISEEIYQLAWSLGRSWDRDRELEQEKAFSDCILQTMDEPLLILDTRARIQRCNPAFAGLIGIECVELIGREVAQFFTEESADQVLSHFQCELQRLHDQNYALFQTTLEAAPLPVLVLELAPNRDIRSIYLNSVKLGQMLGYSGGELVGQPLDRLLNLKQISTLQRQLREIDTVFSCPEEHPFHWQHADGRKVDATVCLLLIEAQEHPYVVMQLRNESTIHPDLLSMTPFGKLFENNREGQNEQIMVHRTGEEIAVAVSGSLFVVGEEQQKERGAVLAIHDLRSRKREEAREQYAAFQSGIAEMSATILHNVGNTVQGVRESFQDILVRIGEFRKIQQLYSSLSDQLKSSREQGDHEAEEKMSQTLLDASFKLPAAIGEVLPPEALLQRVEMGVEHIFDVIRTQQVGARPEIHQTYFSLPQLLNDLKILTQSDMEKQQVELQFVVPEGIAEPYLPRNQLLQALINLLKNGAESILTRMDQEIQAGRSEIERGLVRLTIELDETFLLIRVEDNGNGVDPEIKEKLFRFGFTTKASGSGCGLHSIGNFVVSCGGKIAMESDGVGLGASIEMKLPMNKRV